MQIRVYIKGKLAHNFSDNTFIQYHHIILFGDWTYRDKKKNYKKKKSKGPKCSMISDKHTDVFQREFPICDVAQGLFGDTPFLRQKGIPLSESIIIQRK